MVYNRDMKTKYIMMVILILLIYCIASYYIGAQIASSLVSLFSSATFLVYWIVYAFLSSAYVLGRVGNVLFPSYVSDWLVKLGSYWLGCVFYLCLQWILVDTVAWLGRVTGLLDSSFRITTPVTALTIMIITGILVLYGMWRARTPRIKAYNIAIHKKSPLGALTIVMVSDLHLGLLVGRKRLEELVAVINRLQPDIVLLPGDILDENVGVFLDDDMADVLRRLQPRLGVFGCLGSHEYIWGRAEKAIHTLTQAGVRILRDEKVLLADSFYLIGRDDRYKEKLTDCLRKCLHDILVGCDLSRPLILMDHQPLDLAASQLHGIDLCLSGHTHHGQLFPLNLLIGAFFKIDWGYGRQGNFQIIVSSGFGTWGPPIRVGTTPEVVMIRVNFGR